jgi:hypothetical protein
MKKNQKNKYRIGVSLIISVAILAVLITTSSMFLNKPGNIASAQSNTFQAGHIIDDNIFTNSGSLTEIQIQQFLNNAVGVCQASSTCINNYAENPTTFQNNYGNTSINPNNPGSMPAGWQSAAQIIFNQTQAYGINPEVLLVTMEKEQGLTTSTNPPYSAFEYSMGYACPDTSPCSGNYADFYSQISGSAWQFRDYLNNPGAFNYWIGNNNIAYAPGCAGSVVDIQNAATAALYIYTPYQPDANVLANTNPVGSSYPGGTVSGDSCAAYGNRNFWWYFNSWFGPSVDTNVSLATENGGSTIYVLYDGIKQGVPSPDVLNAWGLNGLPVITLDPSIFNSIPNASTVLSRYVTDTTNGHNYFADNGSFYYTSSNDSNMWGNFPGQSLAQVTTDFLDFANNAGEISDYIYVSGNTTYYAVDNGTLHPITSGAVYNLFAGDNVAPMQLSSAYFNSMTTGPTISSPLITYNGNNYVLSNGDIFSISSSIAPLLPSSWQSTTIGSGLFNKFTSSGSLKFMITAPNLSTIYLLNNGLKSGISASQTYTSFMEGSNNETSIVSSDLLNYINTSSTILSNNIVEINSSYYIINSGLQLIPTSLYGAYDPTANTSIVLDNTYLSLFTSLSNVTDIVKSSSGPGIYFLDNDSKLPFSNLMTFGLISGNTPITNLTDIDLSQFTTGQTMENYITNGTSSYLIDQGNSYLVPSAGMASAWNLTSPITLSASAVSSFPNIGILSQHTQITNGQFCLIDTKAYCAIQAPLITMWGFLGSDMIYPSQKLLDYLNLLNLRLSPFASGQSGQTYGGTIYISTAGKLMGIPTIAGALNLGLANYPVMTLDSFTMSQFIASHIWQGYLSTDGNGNTWVLDSGTKHSLTSQFSSAWIGSNTPTLLGTDYLSLLPTGPAITNSIISPNQSTIYGIQNGESLGFASMATYLSSGLTIPPTVVSSNLIQNIPYGGIWP